MPTVVARRSEPVKFAVIGHPVAHSLSPQIHARFAELVDIDLRYELADVAPADFREFVTSGYQAAYSGFNVTLPHKQAALTLAQEKTDRARDAGAANTLTLSETGIRADNTDGEGLVKDMRRQGIALSGASIVLLGAGGAARGVLPALIEAGVSEIQIANRTLARAEELRERFSGRGAHLVSRELSSWEEGFEPHGIVQATAAGHAAAAPWASCRPGRNTWCYDLSYGSASEGFLDWARKRGVGLAVDGLGMLVEQAAASFELWHGVRPPTDSVLTFLRGCLS